jgi:hypothetical protein
VNKSFLCLSQLNDGTFYNPKHGFATVRPKAVTFTQTPVGSPKNPVFISIHALTAVPLGKGVLRGMHRVPIMGKPIHILPWLFTDKPTQALGLTPSLDGTIKPGPNSFLDTGIL